MKRINKRTVHGMATAFLGWVCLLSSLPAQGSPGKATSPAVLSEEHADSQRVTPPVAPAIDEITLLPILLDLARMDRPDLQQAGLEQARNIRHPFLLESIRYIARRGNNALRIDACETLAIYQHVSGLAELKVATLDDHTPLALRAIELLADFPLPMIRDHLSTLAAQDDLDPKRRLAALLSLRHMGTKESQESLAKLLTTLPPALADALKGDTQVRAALEAKRIVTLRRLFTLAHLKGRLEAASQIGTRFDSLNAQHLIATCLQDKEPNFRLTAFNQAAHLEPLHLEKILLRVLNNWDPLLRESWLQHVTLLAPQVSAALLTKAIHTNYPEAFREGALLALGQTDALLESQLATNAIVSLFANRATDPARLRLAEALTLRPAPEAFAALRESLPNHHTHESVRALALATLIERRPDGALQELLAVATGDPAPHLRLEASIELVENYCEVLKEKCRELHTTMPSDYARGIFVGSAGLFGATTFGLLSQAAGGNQPMIAALSGAILGGGTAYLLTPDDGLTTPQAMHFSSMGLFGGLLGLGIGAMATDDFTGSTFAWSLLAGQTAGVAAGAFSFQTARATSEEILLAHWTGIEATTTALGAVLLFAPEDSTELDAPMALGGSTLFGLAAGVLPMWLVGPNLQFNPNDGALITLATLGGGVLGGLGATAFSDKDAGLAAVGGFGLGQGLGYAAGLVASQYTDWTAGELTWLSLASTAGTTLGTGVGHLAQENTSLFAFAGGAALATTAALSASHFDISWSDADMALVGLLVGGGLGATIPLIDNQPSLSGSASLVGASAGLLGGLIYDHLSHVPVEDSALSLGGALTGALLGAGIALAPGDEPSRETMGGLLTGFGALGFGGMLLAAPAMSFEDGDYLLSLASMVTGSFVGSILAPLASNDGERSTQRAGGAMLGAAAGLTTGVVLSQYSSRSTSETAEVFVIGTLGSLAGGGAAYLTPNSSNDIHADGWLTLTGTALGLTAGALLAPHTSYETEDYALATFMGLYGGVQGSLLPGTWTDDWTEPGEHFTTQVTGGAMLGTALGTASGLALSQYANFSVDDVNELALGAIASSIFGAGIGLMVPVDQPADARPWATGLQVAGLLGTAATGFLAPHTDFSKGDRALGFLATAYGAWQGAGASLLLNGSDRQVAGAVLATTALGAAGGAAISQYVDASQSELLAAFSGSVWGAWIGGMGSIALEQDFDVEMTSNGQLAGFFVGSDLGLALSSLAMSPLMEMDPLRVGWINIYGLSGMALGSALAAIFPKVPFWTSNVTGASAGLIVGAVVTSFIDMPGLLEDTPPAQSDESPQIVQERSRPFHYPGQITAVLPQFQITPITAPDGSVLAPGNRVVLGVMGLWN